VVNVCLVNIKLGLGWDLKFDCVPHQDKWCREKDDTSIFVFIFKYHNAHVKLKIHLFLSRRENVLKYNNKKNNILRIPLILYFSLTKIIEISSMNIVIQ